MPEQQEQAVEAEQVDRVSYEELVSEIQQLNPGVVEIAALRIQNRKLRGALRNDEPSPEQSQ